mgnify:CR=1 FL=1|jgi:hypothetical protein
MRKDSVLSLLYGIGAQMAAVNFIQRTVYELEDDGDVTELIADNLEEAYTGLETARDNLLDLAKEMEE